MRNLFRFSIGLSFVCTVLALLSHLRAITGVWAGVPYRADIMVYPNIWLDRWSVGFAVAAVIFFAYGAIFMLMAGVEKADEIDQHAKLRVLSGS